MLKSSQVSSALISRIKLSVSGNNNLDLLPYCLQDLRQTYVSCIKMLVSMKINLDLLPLFTSFTSNLFFKFSISYCIQHCLLFCATLFHLCHYFCLLLFFFTYQIQQIVLVIAIYWVLVHAVFLLDLILVSSKVVRFHNEAHTFLYQKS